MEPQKPQADQISLAQSTHKTHHNRLAQVYHFYVKTNLAKRYPTAWEAMQTTWRLWRDMLKTKFLPKFNSDYWRTLHWPAGQQLGRTTAGTAIGAPMQMFKASGLLFVLATLLTLLGGSSTFASANGNSNPTISEERQLVGVNVLNSTDMTSDSADSPMTIPSFEVPAGDNLAIVVSGASTADFASITFNGSPLTNMVPILSPPRPGK